MYTLSMRNPFQGEPLAKALQTDRTAPDFAVSLYPAGSWAGRGRPIFPSAESERMKFPNLKIQFQKYRLKIPLNY
jgi:hypothetical protein